MTWLPIQSFAPKDPSEEDFFEIDFSDRMPPTDSIASIVTVFVDDSGEDGNNTDAALLIDQFAYEGQSVSGRWQEGTAEATYRITARVTTVQGRTLDKSGDVLITNT